MKKHAATNSFRQKLSEKAETKKIFLQIKKVVPMSPWTRGEYWLSLAM